MNKNIQIEKKYNTNTSKKTEKVLEKKKLNTSIIKINQFACMTKPAVQDTIPIENILKIIKEGDDNIKQIKKAREFGKGTDAYDKIKKFSLPTFRFSFLFDSYATNSNITASTGLIYIDADYVEAIPENEYVFAKWKSLSNKGYGILIKVANLKFDNFKEVYNELSKIIGIDSDSQARKANQQTVLSYDPALYVNNESKVYNYLEKKKVSSLNILKKKKEGIVTNDTFKTNSKNIKFDNIGDYFDDDTPYIVFDEYEEISKIYIGKHYSKGNRNTIMYYFLSQLAIYNKEKDNGFLLGMGKTINNKMYPKLSDFEFNTILNNVITQRDSGKLKLIYNSKRRILFNPFLNLSKEYKRGIVGSVLGNIKRNKTRGLIYSVLESWDFSKDGKITQKKVFKKIDLSMPTIKRYWKDFHDYLSFLQS